MLMLIVISMPKLSKKNVTDGKSYRRDDYQPIKLKQCVAINMRTLAPKIDFFFPFTSSKNFSFDAKNIQYSLYTKDKNFKKENSLFILVGKFEKNNLF
jgi:hypothetical protein